MLRLPRKLRGGPQSQRELPSPPPPSGRDSTDDPWAWPAATNSQSLMLHIGSSKPITGDAQHQRTLLRAAGRLGALGPSAGRRQLIVQLEREAEKRRSPAAVRIAFNGETVGQVPVVQFHGSLPSLTDPNPDWWGDWDDIEVRGEGHHQDFLAEHRFRMNVAELIIGEQGLVHVEIDGTRVGHLTSKMSDRYRQGVARQSTGDGPVTVFCKVKVGPHKVEVTVKLPEREALTVWEIGL